MSAANTTRYWMSTVSLEHVRIGVEGSFCQVCHGKKSPLARMSKGDWIIYYSPKTSMDGSEVCQKFTAIGQIADDHIYSFKMSEDFVPFRRKVTYVKKARPLPIRPLLDRLSFIQDKKNWGMRFRYGLFEIQESDFKLIYQGMTSKASEEGKE